MYCPFIEPEFFRLDLTPPRRDEGTCINPRADIGGEIQICCSENVWF